MNKKIITVLAVLAVICVFFAGYGFAVLTSQKNLGVGVRVISDVEIGIYDSSTSTTEIVNVDLGNILPTETKTFSIWINNTSAIDLSLSFTTENWLPDYAEGNMTFTYKAGKDYPAGAFPILAGHRKGEVEFSLTALDTWISSEDISFTIVITGTTVSP
mgnify:CR=1 FL=1